MENLKYNLFYPYQNIISLREYIAFLIFFLKSTYCITKINKNVQTCS